MAGSDDDSAKGSFRQNQQSRKRREPPIIDAKATDVSGRADEPQSDPATAAQQPEMPKPDAIPAVDTTAETDEPVLFGQVLRGSVPQSPKSEASAETQEPARTIDPIDPPTADEAAGSQPAAVASPLPSEATPSDGPKSRSTDEPNDGAFGSGPSFDDPSALRRETAPSPVSGRAARRSPVATILAAVAVLLLLVIAGLLFAGPQRSGADELKAALDAANGRIAALEARADPGLLAAQLTQLDQRTDALDTAVATLGRSADALSTRLDAVGAKADDTATRLAAMPPLTPASDTNAPPPGADAPPPRPENSAEPSADAGAAGSPVPAVTPADLAALSGRVDELSSLPGKLADVTQALDALRTSVTALPKTDLGPIDKRVSDLGDRFGALDRAVSAVSATVAALPKLDLDPVKAAIAATDQRLAPLEAALATPKAEDRATEARAVGSADEARAAPVAVVAQEASRGIEDGRPIAKEVDALRALGVDDAALTPLNAIAEQGAPTIAALKASWAEVEPQVLTAVRPAGPDSLLDRFKAGARSIVSVKRVGAPAGEDAGSIAGRISAALASGDADAALAEWAKLPDAGRTLSQPWADAVRSRLDAQAAAEALASGAIETLAKAKG